MTTIDLVSATPLLITAATSVVLMLLIAIRRNHKLSLTVSLVGIAAAFISLWPVSHHGPGVVSALLLIDNFAVLYMGIVLAVSGAVLLFAYNYLESQQEHKEEFYILVLLAAVGGMVL